MKRKRKKSKPDYYRVQIKKTAKSKWKTPGIREWGIKRPNKFKSKWEARKFYFRLAQTTQARKLNDVRIKGFKK